MMSLLKICPILVGLCDIDLLCRFIASAQQEHCLLIHHCEVDPIAGTPCDFQLANPILQKAALAEIPEREPVDLHPDLGPSYAVPESIEPIHERTLARGGQIELDPDGRRRVHALS